MVECHANCVLNNDCSEQYNARLNALSAVYSTRLLMLSWPGLHVVTQPGLHVVTQPGLHVVTHALSTGDRRMLDGQSYP